MIQLRDTHYIWVDARKSWQERRRGGDRIISRMYVVSPRNVELFQLLSLHVSGPQSFEHVRTYEGVVYDSFVEACHARGIASDDDEWWRCLDEAKEFQSPN